MATARSPKATPGNEPVSPHGTTPKQQANIRLVLQSELAIAHAQTINVESTVLYNALTTKRHADIDAEDDGSPRSEVLKNAIDLLQRFHRCAPLYLKMAEGYRQRNNNFFAKEIFCRTFCSDIEGFDNKANPRAWIDVFHFFQAMKKIWDGSLLGGLKVSGRYVAAAGFDAREEIARAGTRTRKGAMLWELMGLASKDIDKYGNMNPEFWCFEAAVRVGSWRKRLKEDRDSLFRLPVEDDWGKRPDDILAEHDGDCMKLFKDLEKKLEAFYKKCNEQMPKQRTALPERTKKLLARAATSEVDQENDIRDQTDLEEMAQRDGTCEETTPETTIHHDFWRDDSPQTALHGAFILKSSFPHRTALQNGAPSRGIPQKRAHKSRTLKLRANEEPSPRNSVITEDPRQFIAPRDPLHRTLEHAKGLIANVLRANGQEPDWDPKLPRMVIGASMHLNGSIQGG